MKAFQCSKCTRLQDFDETCQCVIGIRPPPRFRENGDGKLCRENFEELEESKRWHEKFSWE